MLDIDLLMAKLRGCAVGGARRLLGFLRQPVDISIAPPSVTLSVRPS